MILLEDENDDGMIYECMLKDGEKKITNNVISHFLRIIEIIHVH